MGWRLQRSARPLSAEGQELSQGCSRGLATNRSDSIRSRPFSTRSAAAFKVVVGDAPGHSSEVLEGPDVAVEEQRAE